VVDRIPEFSSIVCERSSQRTKWKAEKKISELWNWVRAHVESNCLQQSAISRKNRTYMQEWNTFCEGTPTVCNCLSAKNFLTLKKKSKGSKFWSWQASDIQLAGGSSTLFRDVNPGKPEENYIPSESKQSKKRNTQTQHDRDKLLTEDTEVHLIRERDPSIRRGNFQELKISIKLPYREGKPGR
jgi:hypothetical protein